MAEDREQSSQSPQARKGRLPALTRRRFLVVGGGMAAAAALYTGLAVIQQHPMRRVAVPPPQGYPVGQYQIADYGVRVQADPESAVEVIIPPVWNLVITAQLTRAPGQKEQQRLEAALRTIESTYPYSPAGVFVLVAYGVPYFRSYVRPDVFNANLPRMVDSGDRSCSMRFASRAINLRRCWRPTTSSSTCARIRSRFCGMCSTLSSPGAADWPASLRRQPIFRACSR